MLTAAHLGHLVTVWVTTCLSSSMGAQMGRDWAAARGAPRQHLGLVWMERLGRQPCDGRQLGKREDMGAFYIRNGQSVDCGPQQPCLLGFMSLGSISHPLSNVGWTK